MPSPALLDRSLAIIKGLQEEDGGITATLRDDVYPYVYPRDAVFMTMALNRFSEFDRSKRFYRFLTKVRRPQGEFYQRYNRGLPYVTNEHELDTTPIVLQGIYDTYSQSGDRQFLSEMWSLVQECANFTCRTIDKDRGLVFTTNSIHETRELEEGYEIWTNSAAVKGLLDASRMAEAMGRPELQEGWLLRARKLYFNLLEQLYDPERGCFMKVMRRSGERVRAPDMSQLAPFYFGICEKTDVLERTLKVLENTLWNSPIGGFNRFEDFEIVHDWHWYTGGTGASWPFFTIWAAGFYRQLGIREKQEACFRFLDSILTQDSFIAEKVAPVAGYEEWKSNELEFGDRIINGIRKIDGNVHNMKAPGYVAWASPLGWAHAEYILYEKGRPSNAFELLKEPIPSAPKIRRVLAALVPSRLIR